MIMEYDPCSTASKMILAPYTIDPGRVYDSQREDEEDSFCWPERITAADVLSLAEDNGNENRRLTFLNDNGGEQVSENMETMVLLKHQSQQGYHDHTLQPADARIQISADQAPKNKKKTSKYHSSTVPIKLPQIVEKRNARERRRVQAVNSAFARLRKVVPIENNRGKRISKVKTLKKAIEYINALDDLLKWDNYYGAYYYEQ